MPGRVIRRRLVCRGAVQAVGFRPTVHRLATSLGVAGWVCNGPDGAVIEVEGRESSVTGFEGLLRGELPPLAELAEISATDVAPRGESTFEVATSIDAARGRARIPPDAALCDACRAELDDPADRRHRYPFTNCTDCGPRYSLVRALPYDRERTAMACFEPCSACRCEYEDPRSRRFHAEPVCCPNCGPRLWLADSRGNTLAEGGAALEFAKISLGAGRIVAIKGLGGFQLACAADDAGVLKRLRERKRRPTKPFALMVCDLRAAQHLVSLAPADAARLESAQAPIVLAPRSPGCSLPEALAPGLDDLGVMLPTTPLHHELFRGAHHVALVMTSGNASDEPICRGNREALRRLSGIADLFLLHDRDVVRRLDDSVVRANGAEPFVVRRSRGYVPRPIGLPVSAPAPVLALGGHLQTTVCAVVGDEAYMSPHIGDLDTESARKFALEVARELEAFLEVEAQVLVCDLHPDYPSSWFAERLSAERGGKRLRVQHHLAHAAAVLGERGAFPEPGERAAALILDGTGWGCDGTAWGCEWLLLDGLLHWRRLARAAPLALVGGETAVREPWRVAVAALAAADRADLLSDLPLAERVAPEKMQQVAALARRRGWPLTSGAGRLFEAAGAVLGCAARNEWEGEAAARLEALAARAGRVERWSEPSLPRDAKALPLAALLVETARRAIAGEDPARVAAGLHRTFAALAAELTVRVLPRGLNALALGGGCMVNRLLRAALVAELASRGLDALLPRDVPPGDAGLAYGQAVIASVASARNAEPSFEGDA